MKQRLLLLSLLIAAVIGVQAAEVNGVRITAKDATGKTVNYDFLFTSEPKLTYQNVYINGEVTGQEVVITGKDVKGRFGEDELILSKGSFESVRFVNVDPSGIHGASSDSNVTFKMAGGHGMEISGLAKGEKIGIYTLDGQKVASAKATADGKASIAISGSEAGTVYVVKTGRLSFKVRTK